MANTETRHTDTQTVTKDGSLYVLPVNQREELERLQLQQWVLTSFYRTHLSQLFAPVDLQASSAEHPIHVLDVGCGTGAWSMPLAEASPHTTHFHLSDIKDNGFSIYHPSPPPNVDFTLFDAVNDWETSKAKERQWLGKAKLVHSRLFLFALTRTQWRKYLAGAFKALAPGGYIQIGEIDPARFAFGFTHPRDARNDLHDKLRSFCDSLDMAGITIVHELPEMLEETGFVHVHQYDGWTKGGAEAENLPDQPVPGAVFKWHDDTYKTLAQVLVKHGRMTQQEADAAVDLHSKTFRRGGDDWKIVYSTFVAMKPAHP